LYYINVENSLENMCKKWFSGLLWSIRPAKCRKEIPGLGSCQSQVWQLPNSGSLGFGSCQTQVWHLPNSGSLGLGSCQTQVWQLPNSGSLGFGSCQTQVNQSLAIAKPEFGSCQNRVWQLPGPGLRNFLETNETHIEKH
jgi:hypothetical protein